MQIGRRHIFQIEDSSQVPSTRRHVVAVARERGLSETEAGNAAIAVTEAGMNILKHGGGGFIHLGELRDGEGAGIEVIAIDAGPGIMDLAKCLVDGYSTAATPGNGLGAMKRLSTEFDAYTRPGAGSAFRMAFRAGNKAARADAPKLGVICLPLPGLEANGDGFAVRIEPQRVVLMIADGLGHGLQAASASRAALESFEAHPAPAPAGLMEQLHADLRGTVGAVIGIAALARGANEIFFCGIGNIAARVFHDGSRQFVSTPGIVGHNMRKVTQFGQPWPRGALLVMHSDGLASQWNLDDYPALEHSHPALIAAVLHRDFSRGRDDVTVLAFREGN